MSDRKPSLGFRLSPWHLTLDDLEQSWFKIIKITRQISHTGMVVPECYKDDVESQWKSLKYDPDHPKTPEPMATKIGTGDYVPDIHPRAKLHYDPIRRFCPPPCICEVAYQSFLGSSNSLPPRPLCRFWRSVRQKTSFRARMCLLGFPRTNFYMLTPFSQIFVVSRRDLENFGPKRALTWRFRQ